MVNLSTLFSVGVAFTTGLVAASPMKAAQPCAIETYYTNTASATGVAGSPTLIGDKCSNPQETGATTPCQLTTSSDYETSVEISIGVDLGLNVDEISSGLSVGVSFSTSTTTGEQMSQSCPLGGPWTCGMTVVPYYVSVSGITNYLLTGECLSGPPGSQPYTVLYPEVDANNLPVTDAPGVCACPDFPGSTDPGAPPLCPSNCKDGSPTRRA